MKPKSTNATRVSIDRKTTAAPAALPKPAPSQRELTPAQESILDFAGDLVVNGGDLVNLKMLVRAVTAHEWAVQHSTHAHDNELSDAASYAESWHEAKAAEIMKAWPDPLPAKEERPAKTATEMVRANVREKLRVRFEEFLYEGQPEELRLLESILALYESEGPGEFECRLAEVFMYELGSKDTFVRVARGQVTAVKNFVNFLNCQTRKGA